MEILHPAGWFGAIMELTIVPASHEKSPAGLKAGLKVICFIFSLLQSISHRYSRDRTPQERDTLQNPYHRRAGIRSPEKTNCLPDGTAW